VAVDGDEEECDVMKQGGVSSKMTNKGDSNYCDMTIRYSNCMWGR
jgi:hypothetical protein